MLVLGPASAAPGWNSGASDAGGLACDGPAGSTHEDDDDGAAVNGAEVVVSWAEGADCPLPNWKDPTAGWVAEVGRVPVA